MAFLFINRINMLRIFHVKGQKTYPKIQEEFAI